jgi:hypothetical protein
MSSLNRFLESIEPLPSGTGLTSEQRRLLVNRLQDLGQAAAELAHSSDVKRRSADLLRLAGRIEAAGTPTIALVAEVADSVGDFARRARESRDLDVLGSPLYGVIEVVVEVARDKQDLPLLDRVQRTISSL